jgi:UDP-N-acetylmuramate-alanine ligase
MAALAHILRDRGVTVTGSELAIDRTQEPRLRRLAAAGVTIAIGHDARNVPETNSLKENNHEKKFIFYRIINCLFNIVQNRQRNRVRT